MPFSFNPFTAFGLADNSDIRKADQINTFGRERFFGPNQRFFWNAPTGTNQDLQNLTNMTNRMQQGLQDPNLGLSLDNPTLLGRYGRGGSLTPQQEWSQRLQQGLPYQFQNARGENTFWGNLQSIGQNRAIPNDFFNLPQRQQTQQIDPTDTRFLKAYESSPYKTNVVQPWFQGLTGASPFVEFDVKANNQMNPQQNQPIYGVNQNQQMNPPIDPNTTNRMGLDQLNQGLQNNPQQGPYGNQMNQQPMGLSQLQNPLMNNMMQPNMMGQNYMSGGSMPYRPRSNFGAGSMQNMLARNQGPSYWQRQNRNLNPMQRGY